MIKEINYKKILRKIRKAEEELLYASPERSAWLTSKIVRQKSAIFKKKKS